MKPSILWKILISITEGKNSSTHEVSCLISSECYMQGSSWHPGLVVVHNDDFDDADTVVETIAASFNEGGRLEDSIGYLDDNDDLIKKVSWQIPEAIKKILDDGIDQLPIGSELTTEDGYKFTLTEEGWSDGDMTFGTIFEIDASFTVQPAEKPAPTFN